MSHPSRLRFPILGLAAVIFAIFAVNHGYAEQPQASAKRQKSAVVRLQRDMNLARQLDTPSLQADSISPLEDDPVVLDLRKARFSYPRASVIDPTVPAIYDMLCYNGKAVGPTIRVKRGQKFKILVKNNLHGPVDPGDDPLDGANPWEVPHGLCTTNLHTHGLHVSPSGNSDNVYAHIDPGQHIEFEYQLPKNHPSGTFWYHPHKHGSVAYQLSNGVAGALIVEGNPDDDINDLEDIPEIAAAAERILILQYYTFSSFNDKDGKPVGFINAGAIYNVNPHGDLFACDGIAPGGPLNATPGSAVVAVNGQLLPRFNAAPGEIQRWRFVHGGWDVPQDLSWYEQDGITPTADISMYEIALDGLATGGLDRVSPMTIAPGQRTDLLVKTAVLPPGVEKTYYLMRLGYDHAVGGIGDPLAPRIMVAKMVVGGKSKTMKLPNPKDLAKCRPFAPVGDAELVPATIPNGTLIFAGEDPPNPPDLTGAQYTINGLTFLQQQPIRLTLGTAQDWTITAVEKQCNDHDFGGHPFHIHVNPFQVTSFTDPKGVTTPMNVWRDTLFVPVGGSYKIRSRYQDLTGLSVLHCHILDHEDQGMMVPIRLVKPNTLGKNAVDPSSLLVKADQPAAPLILPDAHGPLVDLGEFKGRNVILVFFKGIRCGYCVQDLSAMVREARRRSDDTLEIVAVSDRKVDDLPKALKVLGVTGADRFHLLIDESHDVFKEFGCGSGAGARHGLFLVDGKGMIRSRYVGETPFGDSDEVFDRLRLIAGLAKDKDKDKAKTAENDPRKALTTPKVIVGTAAAVPATPIGGGGFDD